MKYLVLLLVFFGFAWYWRHNRERTLHRSQQRRPNKPTAAQDMIACAHCGTHVPVSEAITGAHGSYCCPAHRALQER